MAVDNENVAKIAHLARLELPASEEESVGNQLSAILTLIDQLNILDTSSITPLAHPLDAKQRLRPDEVSTVNERELFLALAPHAEAGLYLVPQVVE